MKNIKKMTKIIDKINKRFPVPVMYLKFFYLMLKEPFYFIKRIIYKFYLPKAKIQINPNLGFVKVAVNEINGLKLLMPMLDKLCKERIEALDQDLLSTLGGQGKVKPYFLNLLRRDDLEVNAEIIKFALSDEMLSIVAGCMGFIPNLSHIALFYSGFGDPYDFEKDEPQGTQKFHIDNHDISHIKFFLYLDDVSETDGPLVVLPAKESLSLRLATNRFLSTKPFKRDSEFKEYVSDSQLIPLIGKRGESFFINTSKVYHFGSRYLRGGRRIALVIHYVANAEYSRARNEEYQDLNLVTSHEIRKILNLSPIQSTAYKLLSKDNKAPNASEY